MLGPVRQFDRYGLSLMTWMCSFHHIHMYSCPRATQSHSFQRTRKIKAQLPLRNASARTDCANEKLACFAIVWLSLMARNMVPPDVAASRVNIQNCSTPLTQLHSFAPAVDIHPKLLNAQLLVDRPIISQSRSTPVSHWGLVACGECHRDGDAVGAQLRQQLGQQHRPHQVQEMRHSMTPRLETWWVLHSFPPCCNASFRCSHIKSLGSSY